MIFCRKTTSSQLLSTESSKSPLFGDHNFPLPSSILVRVAMTPFEPCFPKSADFQSIIDGTDVMVHEMLAE